MTDTRPESLRIALLHHRYGRPTDSGASPVRELARALRDAGHRPQVLTSHPGRAQRTVESGIPVVRTFHPPEALLRWRGFATPLTHTPFGVAALLAGRFDLAHAFSASDALSVLAWRRLTGRPAVFTCLETLGRERLADRRLRLWLLQSAVEATDAVVAPTDEVRLALWRWLAVDAAVIDAQDGLAHERLYQDVLPGRRSGPAAPTRVAAP